MTVRVVLLSSMAWMAAGRLAAGHAAAAQRRRRGHDPFSQDFGARRSDGRLAAWRRQISPVGRGGVRPAGGGRTVARRRSSPAAPAASIIAGRYEAKFVGDQLVGKRSLNVVLAGAPPAMLPFEPCNLALSADHLERPPAGSSADRRPRGLGTHQRRQARLDGRSLGPVVLRVVAGRAPRSRRHRQLLVRASRLRRPTSCRWNCPRASTPVVDRGMVVGSEPAGELPRRWQIELGGNHRFRLRIVPAGAASHRPQLALLRESRTYDISPRGWKSRRSGDFRPTMSRCSRLPCCWIPGLQLASARYGDASIPWSAAPAPDGHGTRVVLPLPEPIRDAERVIRLAALGPTVLDRPWRLPRIRVEGRSGRRETSRC